MAELNLPNIREGGNIRFRIGLEDGGVAVDWSGLEDIRVFLYADAQKQVSGEMCEVAVDEEDNTVLKCKYSGDDVQYRGINSVLVRAKYLGEIKVYDKPAINIVARTSEATGVVEIDDPVVPVQISVEDVSTSLLNNAIDAAINAAAEAEKAAHLVPLQVLEDCVEATGKALEAASKAPYIDETTGNWFVWDAEAGEYVDSGKTARGATGNGIASWSVVESSEDAGNNVVTVTFTDGTSESFNVKNGHTGNGIASIVQTVESPDDAGTNVITITMTNGTVVTFNVKNGSKGTPGVAQAAYKSVSSLPTASAQTMDKIYLTPSGTSGVYNMSYTEFDGSAYSWQDLGTTAIQLSDYATKAELDQLEAEVDGLQNKSGKVVTLSVPATAGTDISNNVEYFVYIKPGTDVSIFLDAGASSIIGSDSLSFYKWENGVRSYWGGITAGTVNTKTVENEVEGLSFWISSTKVIASGTLSIEVRQAGELDSTIADVKTLAERKVEKLAWVGPSSAGHTWAVGEKIYNTSSKKLAVCIAASPNQNFGTAYNPSEESAYLYENEIYIWDGTNLRRVVPSELPGALSAITRNENRLSSLIEDVRTFPPSIFQVGKLYLGNIVADSKQIATTNKQKEENNILITARTGYRFVVHFYDSNGNYTSNSGWRTEYRILAGESYRLDINTTGGTTDADVNTFSQGVEYIQETELAIPLDVLGKANKKFNAVAGDSITATDLHNGKVFPVKIKKGQQFTLAISGAISTATFYAIKADDSRQTLGGSGTYFAPFDIEAIGIYVTSGNVTTGEYTITITGASINDLSLALIGEGEVEYYGEKLPSFEQFKNKFRCSLETIVSENMVNGGLAQANAAGLVVVNGKAFSFNDGSTCSIYDLSTNTLIETATLPWSAHNNNAQPTPYYYDADDDYPLMLVSRGDYAGTGEQKFYYVRVTESGGSFTFTIVKTFSYSGFVGAEYNCSWFANYETQELYCYTYPNGAWSVRANNPILFHKFDLPPIGTYESVNITDSDIKETITLQDHWIMQSGLFHNGKILLQAMADGGWDNLTINGVPYDASKGRHFLFVIDQTGYIETLVPLHGYLEQEGLCIYDGSLYMSEKNSSAPVGQLCFLITKYTF